MIDCAGPQTTGSTRIILCLLAHIVVLMLRFTMAWAWEGQLVGVVFSEMFNDHQPSA